MDRELFKKYLKECNINKKALATRLNLPYGTVNNWGTSNPYPDWLESWLQNYKKSMKFDRIREMIKDEME